MPGLERNIVSRLISNLRAGGYNLGLFYDGDFHKLPDDIAHIEAAELTTQHHDVELVLLRGAIYEGFVAFHFGDGDCDLIRGYTPKLKSLLGDTLHDLEIAQGLARTQRVQAKH